jgi:hypothetical protein
LLFYKILNNLLALFAKFYLPNKSRAKYRFKVAVWPIGRPLVDFLPSFVKFISLDNNLDINLTCRKLKSPMFLSKKILIIKRPLHIKPIALA